MPIDVNMAKISPTMESGQIVKWLVKVGDKVKEGDTLAEVQTDKAVMPMEAFDEGVVARIDVAEGQEVPVGQRVLVLAKPGEDPNQAAGSSGGAPSAGTKTAEAKDVGAKAEPQPQPKAQPKPEATPAAAKATPPPRAPHIGAEVTNTPTMPELTHAPAGGNGHRPAQPSPAAPSTGAARVKSSPLARKMAAAAQIDLGQVPATGPGGRVIRRDVEALLAQRQATPAGQPAAARPAPAVQPTQPQRISLSRMRATIAQRMSEAKRTAPEIHVVVDIRVDQLVHMREELNRQLAPEKIKLSVGDFVTKGVALALKRHPGLNASFENNEILQYPDVNLGLAVAVEGGLIVPVLRNADRLGLREIRTQSEVLYQAARQIKVTADQLTGATFTISNLGMYGVRQFDAILNLPQVGILAVGAAQKRPVIEGDSLVAGTEMTVTLTADHRAVDGAAAAEFLRTLKGLLEEPAAMLL